MKEKGVTPDVTRSVTLFFAAIPLTFRILIIEGNIHKIMWNWEKLSASTMGVPALQNRSPFPDSLQLLRFTPPHRAIKEFYLP